MAKASTELQLRAKASRARRSRNEIAMRRVCDSGAGRAPACANTHAAKYDRKTNAIECDLRVGSFTREAVYPHASRRKERTWVTLKAVSPDTTSGAVLLGRVFLSRAFKSQSAGDWSRVLRQVASARREAGRPILCFMVVDPDAEVPLEADRAAMQRATTSLLNYCESLTLVVAGNELKRTLLRTVLRGMATLAGQRIRVVDHLEAAARLAAEPELELPELERRGREAGVWDAPSGNAPEA